jgi:hypothetical protein
MLCRRCNVTLGMVKEDPEILYALANYLKAHQPEGASAV